jgi:hypothetical protein
MLVFSPFQLTSGPVIRIPPAMLLIKAINYCENANFARRSPEEHYVYPFSGNLNLFEEVKDGTNMYVYKRTPSIIARESPVKGFHRAKVLISNFALKRTIL